MITMKELIESGNQSSPDGIHWEPAIPESSPGLIPRLKDCINILKGKAIAIRQTEPEDLLK